MFPGVWFYFTWVLHSFSLSAYLDVLDGYVAGKNGANIQIWSFLDSTLDRISDSVIVLGLIWSGR